MVGTCPISSTNILRYYSPIFLLVLLCIHNCLAVPSSLVNPGESVPEKTISSNNSTSDAERTNEKNEKQGLQCYALRCYGHFVNIHRCCPGYHCSIHLPLFGGICLRDPQTMTQQQQQALEAAAEEEEEAEEVVPEQMPSFEVTPSPPLVQKEEPLPVPVTEATPVYDPWQPTLPSYASWAVFPYLKKEASTSQ